MPELDKAYINKFTFTGSDEDSLNVTISCITPIRISEEEWIDCMSGEDGKFSFFDGGEIEIKFKEVFKLFNEGRLTVNVKEFNPKISSRLQ